MDLNDTQQARLDILIEKLGTMSDLELAASLDLGSGGNIAIGVLRKHLEIPIWAYRTPYPLADCEPFYRLAKRVGSYAEAGRRSSISGPLARFRALKWADAHDLPPPIPTPGAVPKDV